MDVEVSAVVGGKETPAQVRIISYAAGQSGPRYVSNGKQKCFVGNDESGIAIRALVKTGEQVQTTNLDCTNRQVAPQGAQDCE